MKKKAGIIATSVAAIAVCSSLIAGSTFALFTSESEVNIAVNAAKVALSAEVETGAATSRLGGAALGRFSNADGLAIQDIAPEDEYEFKVKVTNTSSIKTLYRTKIEFTDTELASALTVTVDGVEYAGIKSYTTPWAALGAKENPEKDLAVKVSFFDQENVNRFKEKTTDVKVIVEGVQGNAGYALAGEPSVVKIPAGKIHVVNDSEELATALQDVAGNGGTVELAGNADLPTENSTEITKDVLFNLNGNDVNVTSKNGSAFLVQNGASMTVSNGDMNVDVNKAFLQKYTASSGITVNQDSSLILDHVTLETSSYGIYTRFDSSEVIVRNSVLICNDVLGACISTNAQKNGEESGISVIVENSTLNSVGAGILMNVPGPVAEDGTEDYSLKMSGTTVNGGLQGVIVRGGKALIKDSTLNAGVERYFKAAMDEIFDLRANGFNTVYDHIVGGKENWTQGNDVPLAALVAGNKSNSYQYPTTVELFNVKTNAPASLVYNEKEYKFYTLYANGNTSENNGALVTFDQKCQLGDYQTGNKFAVVKPMGE